MKAVVLSGGGSNGSYQIGVWKALRHLHIQYDIVTGTSVGALNGALMVQKNYYKALFLWKKLNMKILFGQEEKLDNDKDVFKMFRQEFLKHGGIEIEKVENLIDRYVNTKKFFKSKIDYGLVTVNVSKKKALCLTKKEIEKEKLTDYLMASSACYPAFQIKKIEDDKYVDGGFYDNLPINLAISLGADEVIAVDLNAPGIKVPLTKKIKVTTIKPKNKLSFFLNFNEIGAKRNIIFGYNDTMKVFGKLDGEYFTFKKNHIQKCMTKYQETYKELFQEIMKKEKKLDIFRRTPSMKNLSDEKYFLKILEDLGKMFDMEEAKIYRYQTFNRELVRSVERELLERNKKRKIPNLLKSKEIVLDILEDLKNDRISAVKKKAFLSPKEFIRALYLWVIE